MWGRGEKADLGGNIKLLPLEDNLVVTNIDKSVYTHSPEILMISILIGHDHKYFYRKSMNIVT